MWLPRLISMKCDTPPRNSVVVRLLFFRKRQSKWRKTTTQLMLFLIIHLFVLWPLFVVFRSLPLVDNIWVISSAWRILSCRRQSSWLVPTWLPLKWSQSSLVTLEIGRLSIFQCHSRPKWSLWEMRTWSYSISYWRYINSQCNTEMIENLLAVSHHAKLNKTFTTEIIIMILISPKLTGTENCVCFIYSASWRT